MRIEVEQREMGDYPKRDLTPEHTKRGNGHNSFSDGVPIHPDVLAAYDYVDRVVDAADLKVHGAPAWYGWALREAFLSGVSDAEGRVNAWQPIETAPDDEFVVVFWTDSDGEEYYDFDNKEDGCWVRHQCHYEEFCCCAPPGSTGPRETAPYTHWLKMPKAPNAGIEAPAAPFAAGRLE